MNWEYLKEKIYYWDGAWLDIYVFNIEEQNWFEWVNFVNNTYRISWHNGRTQKNQNQIDFNVIEDYWNSTSEYVSTGTIYLNNKIEIKAHFFDNSEFENDIDPREFQNMEDHEQLMKYLKQVSKIMKREVVLTPENCPETPLIKVKKEEIELTAGLEPSKWPVRRKK